MNVKKVISDSLNYIGKNHNNISVIQIGAGDGITFDDTREYLDKYNWDAILLEANPELYQDLKSNFKDRNNYTFAENIISNRNGMVDYLIFPHNAFDEEPDLPEYKYKYKFLGSLYPLKNTLTDDNSTNTHYRNKSSKDIKVQSLTLESFFEKYSVKNFDILLCNLQGHDWNVLDQLDLEKYKPKFIRLDYMNLSNEHRELAAKKLRDNNYEVFIGKNINAIQKNLWKDILDSDNGEDPISLTNLFNEYGTDKNISEYNVLYESLFHDIKDSFKNVLEIGVGSCKPGSGRFAGNQRRHPHYKVGGSLRAWRDYFPNAVIEGIDIAEDCLFEEHRINSYIISSIDKNQVDEQFGENGKYDLIVDDGLHTCVAQLQTLKNFFPKVKDGGFYVIEDLGGGGDACNLFTDQKEDVEEVIGNSEYYWRGNILFIRKTNTVRRCVDNVKDLLTPLNVSENVDSTVEQSIDVVETVDDKPKDENDSDLTVVTGLWNIGRSGRSWDHYVESFQKLLAMPQKMFIYISKEHEHLVWEKREKHNTFVKIYELEDVKNLYSPFWEKTQNLRTSDEWLNITGKDGWLKLSPQATLEWYLPIVQSKMFLLNDVTIWNPFKTNHFIWIDGGITNTVWDKYLVQDNALSNITKYLDSFLFLSYPYSNAGEIHGFKSDDMNRYASVNKIEYVCRGGLFGGTKEAINEANRTYYSTLMSSLSEGLMGTEESIFTIMSYAEPDKYNRYMLEITGHILKFIKAMLDDNVEMVKVVNRRSLDHVPASVVSIKDLKMSLYMLSFNFPQQVESTIKTWLKHPKWIKDTRNILIDNSTNQDAIEKNEELCKKYNFEHIVTNKNLGINGGRFLAAEHFQNSDSDYYLFLEDDMEICAPDNNGFCRNGFRRYVPDLYSKVLKILEGDDVDFVKLSYTEVYMDNNIQVSWYNVPQRVRTAQWPYYDKLPISGLDKNCPRTKFDTIEVIDGLSYIKGQIYYANWPMVVGKKGNQKMFLDITWANPYEQTWMSQMYQDTVSGKLKPSVLLASPINHNRIVYYKPEERKENAG